MNFRHLFLATLLTIGFPLAALAQQVAAQAFIAAIEQPQPGAAPDELGSLTIEELMDRFGVPGVSIAVVHDFELHWAKGYGTADLETGAPVNTETLFQAASISKPVAAMGVLKATQDGVFGLDDDINGILRSWKLEADEFDLDRPVTPRMLTSHTSGLGDGFGFPGYDPATPIPTALQILQAHDLSNVRPLFMERQPMSLMEYSGGGVTVMQQALSDALERPFEEILYESVLRPIGMENSTFQQPLPAELDGNAARAHSRDGEAMGPKWRVYPELAAAGLWTTPSDLARFIIEVQRTAAGRSDRVLSRATVQEMLNPVGVGDYGVGFAVRKMGEGWYFGHGGSNWGFQSTLLGHKVKGYGLAIMTNGARGSAVAAELSRRIQNAYEWDSIADPAPRGYHPPPARSEVRLPAEKLREYVGTYETASGPAITVTLEEGRLHGRLGGEQRYRFRAEGEDRFFLTVADVQLHFTRGPGGEVTGLTLIEQGSEQGTYTRVR